MDADSFTIGSFKVQANKFLGIIFQGSGVFKQRMVRHLIYGIQTGKDVKLSNIFLAPK